MIEIGKIKEGMTGRQVADLLYENFLAVISGLSGYATEKWVTDKGYITEASLNGYATEQWVTGRGYITASAVAERYATIASVNELAGGVSASLAAVNAALAERVEKTKFAEYFSTEMAKWFVKDDANKGIKPVNSYGLYSDTYVSAKGVSTGTGGGGGGTSYDRLDSWAEYTSAKAGYVLSALLGYDLHTRVNNLANAGYITASALSGYAKLSDIPTSLPASDVYSWAKAASKPSYAFSEITNKPTTLGGYGITDTYTATTIDGKLSGYLPLSGGILSDSWSGGTEIRRKDSNNGYASLIFSREDGTILGRFGFGGVDNPLFITQAGGYNTLIHSGNIGSQSVASAAKLTTPRSIWGQSFDGTGNIDGHMTLSTGFDAGGVNMFVVSDKAYIGSQWYNSVWKGKTHEFEVSGFNAMSIANTGNVLIGTTTDNGSKLYVNGDVRFDGQTRISGSVCFYGKTNLSSDMYIDNQSVGGLNFAWSDGVSRFFIGYNVGIGTTSPTEKLHVAGNIVATGSVTAKSSSDYRLKCEFDYDVDYQERLLRLGRVCDFNYTPHAQKREFAFADDKRHTSVIWQDARKANITGFCSVEEDGYGTVNPLSSDLIFTMVGAIQQGITKTERIEERIVRLEKENAALRKEINDMKGGRYGC